jgi:hypothetical protein
MDIEFLVRRILKEGHDYAKAEYEERSSNSGVQRYYLNRYTAQIHLLNHLEKEFLERNENDNQD